ncbi:hypothetical protein J6I92_07235 [Pseudidiomarina sp. 1APR75-15]|uniref:Uncharacterized protein n=1 Tax=Pseudidiomarina terrestris TaxID=2820060 RepID=A0ABT8MI90_9GAMM|nr:MULTISPECIES: hypothetical protein [unclassified Pseudidiomarina]MDN7125939.1 hypothetical protein [Pseudidiomarina sp. 1APR75-33.1]MDN7129661.1 hypothetical protein [Pseudidiomarina sp. 1APR75-15]
MARHTNWSLIVMVASITFLGGCATGYQSQGFTGGFSETQLDKNVFVVTFKGNGFTSFEKASDYSLLRSAELALETGYEYFAIIDGQSYATNSTYTTPTTSNTTMNAYTYGNSAYGNATTTTYGGQTFNISKPNVSNTIYCFKEKPEGIFVYNAPFLIDSLSSKYGIVRDGND